MIYGAIEEPMNGPDQILPSSESLTSQADGTVKLYLTRDGPASAKPFSVYTMFQETVERFPRHPALREKKNGVWRTWNFQQYFDESRTVAKAFIKLGLERFKGVCIMGVNSPEWVIANFAGIFAGGLSAGVYTTNSPEACEHLASNCKAQIIIVENTTCLNKFLAVKRNLPEIKAIIQWDGIPGAPGVMSWEELLAVGEHETDDQLNDRLSRMAINKCCSLIYTSGTTGPPKGVMCSHDSITWTLSQYSRYLETPRGEMRSISYLPMSHLAAQLVDMYGPVEAGAEVCFADPDALKGALGKNLIEIRPTGFLAVPRVWEKIYEKLQEISAQNGVVATKVATWAKYHGLNYYNAIRDGRTLTMYERINNSLAKKLVLNRVKRAMGLDNAERFASGSAPIDRSILEYFMSLDIPVMEGYGLSESLSICAINRPEPGRFRLGSVGKVMPQTTVKIDETTGNRPGEGEICIRGRNIFMGYLNMEEKTSEAIDSDGWLRTGDIGALDKDGFLYITGRLKELVITAGGENIPPVLIEEQVKRNVFGISSCILVGDKRKYLTLLLTLKSEVDETTGQPLQELTEPCKDWLKQFGCHATTVNEAQEEINGNPNCPLVRAINMGIAKYNATAISNAQKVQKWRMLSHDFSLLTGELNNTLKLKRSYVLDKYKDLIDEMYDQEHLTVPNNRMLSKL